MRGRRSVVAGLVLVGLAGCQADRPGTAQPGPPPPGPRATPTASAVPPELSATAPCPAKGDRPFSYRRGGFAFSGYERGTASTVAILLHESRGTPCDLAGLMARLAAEGMRVVSWTATPRTSAEALALVVAKERSGGAVRVVLVGASAGGATALVAAGLIRPPVSAVVALSASNFDSAPGDVLRAAARYPGPMMAVASQQDPSFAALPALLAAAHSGRELTRVYPGNSDHGKQFVARPDSAVAGAVVAFLAMSGSASG